MISRSEKAGSLIEYVDEDPHIHKHYEEELGKAGVESGMPAL